MNNKESKKIYIRENQCNALLSEAEWNFHFGDSHDGRPYVSDNKYQMGGRETGHFGSGTYFSTYRGEYGNRSSEVSKLDGNYNPNPNFIEISDHIYRVDFDLYKNLYRVRSKKQGDILYTMMRYLNNMYNKIAWLGYYNPKSANYDNAENYQIIKRNAEALGLRCPSYFELTRMAQRHEGIQSFSTVFMEWNGYNGVNVSGVDYYDNTKHGSVIYDLSKVNTDMEEVQPKNLYTGFKDSSYDNTIVSNGYSDEIFDSLRGEYINWYDKLNEMPLNRALRVLKNYTDSGNVLGYFVVKGLKPELIKRYLRLIYVKNPNGYWEDPIYEEVINGKYSKYYTELIDEYGAYYWVNYMPRKGHTTVLINLLSEFAWNIPWSASEQEEKKLKEEYYNKLMSYMDRDLTPYEKEYISENYFETNEEENNG